MSDKKRIIAIVGPTASGKSALGIEIAKRVGGEIVSCDSMQLYKQMNIGTAKPTESEKEGIPHHIIDCVEPEVTFTCADYVALAESVCDDVISRGKIPIFCGGTGLYLDSFLRGGFAEQSDPVDESFRREMEAFARESGNEVLHAKLCEIDPESAEKIHPNNVKRVIRALEIYHTSGVTKSESDRQTQFFPSRYDATVIGITFRDRDRLYERIDRRVDKMLADGLIEETHALAERRVFEHSQTASQAIGYKEILPYIEGRAELASVTEELKRATRRYAKRQITWFSAKDYVIPVYADSEDGMRSLSDIADDAMEIINNR